MGLQHISLTKKKKSRSEEFHFSDSLMLLSYTCLALHHPQSGTPSSFVWNPTCIWYMVILVYHHLCLVYHHLSGTHHPCLVPHHPYLVPHHPCLIPHLHLVSCHLTGTPSLSGTPPCVWNPILSPV